MTGERERPDTPDDNASIYVLRRRFVRTVHRASDEAWHWRHWAGSVGGVFETVSQRMGHAPPRERFVYITGYPYPCMGSSHGLGSNIMASQYLCSLWLDDRLLSPPAWVRLRGFLSASTRQQQLVEPRLEQACSCRGSACSL